MNTNILILSTLILFVGSVVAFYIGAYLLEGSKWKKAITTPEMYVVAWLLGFIAITLVFSLIGGIYYALLPT
jgi:hypothetical protein